MPILYEKGAIAMRNKYGIGIFVLVFLFIYFISYGAYHESSETQEKQLDECTVSDLEKFDTQGYYIYERNGYVVIYKNDKTTPYEYTNILFEELPEMLKQEIQNGKYLKNEEELYGFLENYTS